MSGADSNAPENPSAVRNAQAAAAESIYLHATALSLNGRTALIRGPSGAGKSDLALRCLAAGSAHFVAGTPKLVADDQVIVTRDGAALRLHAPRPLHGKLEVRGLGIITLEPELDAAAVLVCELVAPGAVERLPDPWPAIEILGVRLPVLRLAPFEASAPLKLLTALSMAEALGIPHPARSSGSR